MKNKKILVLCLASCLGVSSLFIGCDTKEDVKNTAEDVKEDSKNAGEEVKEGIKDAGEGVKEGTEGIIDRVKDASMTYSKEDLKKALEEKGVKVEKVETEKSFFSVDSDDYLINGQRISIYEYNEMDKDKLNNDLSTISNDGMTIGGNSVTWKVKPHIYKKGRIIVLYDGDDANTITTLNEILGEAILG